MKKYLVKSILTDNELLDLNAKYLNKNFFNKIIKDESHYVDNNNKTIFVLKKNIIPDNLMETAYNNFVNYAKYPRANRGAAAGLIDDKNLPKYVGEITNRSETRVYYKTKDGKESNRAISNIARSAIAGYYDRKIGSAPPCRLTRFNTRHYKKFKNTIPYVECVDNIYKKYSPFYYKKQRERANESPLYLIGDSCFSTLTLNYNWRTACHYDVGDYTDGLSIISVLGDDNWEGCLIGFPKYKIAVDVRVGDIIIMDSHEMHCNTEFKDSPDNDGNAEFNRLSVVFYLRQNMNNCKSIPNGIKKIEKFLT